MTALYAAACCRMERRVARAVRIGGEVNVRGFGCEIGLRVG